jgi:hypothetical protein
MHNEKCKWELFGIFTITPNKAKNEWYGWECHSGNLHCDTEEENNNVCEIFLCECDKSVFF